jgi:hypothetical protein
MNYIYYRAFLNHPVVSLLVNATSYHIEDVNKKFESSIMSRTLALKLSFTNDFLQTADRSIFIASIEKLKIFNEGDDVEIILPTLTKRCESQCNF